MSCVHRTELSTWLPPPTPLFTRGPKLMLLLSMLLFVY